MDVTLRTTRWLAVSLCLLGLSRLGAAVARAAEPRFTAVLTDGTRISGDEVRNWHEPQAQPTLDGKPLFDPARPARAIWDLTLAPATPPRAYVEFWGGDCLPGEVVQGRSGAESAYDRLPPHLVVQSEEAWNYPESVRRNGELRVATRWLKRIVWQRRGNERFQPGTAVCLDGRRLPFRAVRWNRESVTLLVDQDTEELAYADLAELHLPRENPWELYLDQLAVLAIEGGQRLCQWETTAGLRVTSSTARVLPTTAGNPNDPASWLHAIQPAWALDLLVVSHRKIRVRRYFLPEEPPLTLVEPLRDTPSTGLAAGWGWQRDRNVQGGPLQSRTEEFGWGYGVHAQHQLVFELPPWATAFRTRIGLDRQVAQGGCVRGVVIGGDGAPLFRSDLLIGSSQVIDTGWLGLNPQAVAGGLLTLVADAAHAERPAGADPFDIRDLFDWLEPELRLDRSRLDAEIPLRVPRLLPAWDGWTLENSASGPVQLAATLEGKEPRDARFLTELRPRLPLVTWSRTQAITPRQNWLVLAASRLDRESAPVQLQVRIQGEVAAEFEVPIRSGPIYPEPLIVPLQRYHGQTALIEIVQLGGGPQGKVSWSGVTLVDRLPGTYVIFDDDKNFAGQLNEGQGQASVVRDDAFNGSASLKVTGSEKGNSRLPGLHAAIRENPRVGEYRYIVCLWKKKGGTRVCLQLADDGAWGDAAVERTSLRYDAGNGFPSYGAAKRLDGRLPEEWGGMYRDLYADFGRMTLTGLSFAPVDGEAAYFDYVFLARTLDDLKRGPPTPLAQPTPLFEDQYGLVTRLDQGGAEVKLETTDVYSGTRALRVTRDQKFNAGLFSMPLKVREKPGADEFRYVRFAWKKRGGSNILLQLMPEVPVGSKPDAVPGVRYEAGPKPNAFGLPALQVAQELPAEWTVVTRDLFADFGPVNLVGLSLAPQEGEYALFDHLYLARTIQDLDRVAPPPAAPETTPAQNAP